MFSSPVIPLDCELCQCFSVPSTLLGGAGWVEGARLDSSVLPGRLGFAKIPSHCMPTQSLSRVQLCKPMDYSLLGFSVHGIL